MHPSHHLAGQALAPGALFSAWHSTFKPAIRQPLALAVLALLAGLQSAQAQTAEPSHTTGVVVIQGSQPSSLPTRIPTTIEGISGAQISQTINATDSEDALKYGPSRLVRKRYIVITTMRCCTPGRRAPATAPARWCMPTGCCCPTCWAMVRVVWPA